MIGEDRPDLSIIIAATDSPIAVLRALKALEGQAPGKSEVIVVSEEKDSGLRLRDSASRRAGLALPMTHDRQGKPCPTRKPDIPPVRRLEAPPRSGVPRLRRIGLEAARGRVVAFTEDSCLALPGWADAWLASFDDPSLVAASGSVELAEPVSTLDRAVVFCEYAPFLPGSPAQSPNRLAGNNFAALRMVALRHSVDEVHETALLAAIRRGRALVGTVEAARVRHVRRFTRGEAFADRFRFGLEFGRLRTVEASPVVRWLGLLAGPAIYASQVARLTRTILGNPRHLRPFIQTLPITLALLLAWSLGEWIGWSLGPPRDFSRIQCRCS